MSRNTQGGLGHRLRGRRGESAAPTPAERQWRRRPERNGRRGRRKRDAGGRKRTRLRRTAEQQREKGEEAERRRPRDRERKEAKRPTDEPECGEAGPATPVLIARGGARWRHSAAARGWGRGRRRPGDGGEGGRKPARGREAGAARAAGAQVRLGSGLGRPEGAGLRPLGQASVRGRRGGAVGTFPVGGRGLQVFILSRVGAESRARRGRPGLERDRRRARLSLARLAFAAIAPPCGLQTSYPT